MNRIVVAFATLLMLTGLNVFAQSTGTIRELSGTVELKYSGAANYVTAKVGDTVREDTVISTGFKSTALVELGSAQIVVRPLTRLTLTEIRASSGSETINVSLQTGRVRVDLSPPAGTKASMSVSSPSATASVRGTNFEIDTRNIRVHEGTVGFSGSRGQVVMVGAGSESRVTENGRAVNPNEIKTAGLFPPLPRGSDSIPGGTAAVISPVRYTGSISIDVTY